MVRDARVYAHISRHEVRYDSLIVDTHTTHIQLTHQSKPVRERGGGPMFNVHLSYISRTKVLNFNT